MAKKSSTTKQTAPKEAPLFTVSVNTGDKVITGSGDTILDALKSLTPPGKIVKKTIITLSSGDKNVQLVYTVPRAKRIFYPIAQTLTAKHFALLLK